MLQVKYRKGTMLKLDLGTAGTMLLYEVPYIAVPSLPEASKVTNLEINELKDKEEIKVVVKDCYIEDAHFEQIKEPILKAVQESLTWYEHHKTDDPRMDNLSGVILSRFCDKSDSFSWHIICSEVSSIRELSVITNH
jgi:hypothetical protein